MPLVQVVNLEQRFIVNTGLVSHRMVYAVDGVSFAIKRGTVFGLVGETGCGKTTLGRTLLRLYEPSAGEVYFDGELITSKNIKAYRRKMQIIFQDPNSSLNPRMRVSDIIAEPMIYHKLTASAQESRSKTIELMEMVGLSEGQARRFPRELSEGQRQRVGIARALAVRPEFLICDEPVSSLDVSVQARIINLLQDIRREMNITYMYISHDLLTVQYMSDHLAVMYRGKIVEEGRSDELNANPIHPYTMALFSSLPIPDPQIEKNRQRIAVPAAAETAGAAAAKAGSGRPKGCPFASRCKKCTDQCLIICPPLSALNDRHKVACWEA
ncbi:MAG: ATP-binding cassette domain-containing protein [Oscillospiraceae bacterium]|nr:ATP-binding cassette domain-containing protein [Oscillospiraceae bacterium]